MGTQGVSSRFWRGRYWRAQATFALGLTVLAGIGLWFVARDLGFLLIAAATVAFPIWLVTESWLSLRASQLYSPPPALLGSVLGYVVPFAIGVAVVAVSYSRDRFDRGLLAYFGAILVVGAARAVYGWREGHNGAIGLMRASFRRVSWEGAFVHFAGYVLALAAAIASAGLLDGWSARTAGFVGGAVVGKLVADFMFAQPAPLGDARLSHALMRMTVLSPLWWGLPWGLLAAGYFHILENGRSTFFTSGLPVVYHVVIAVVFVFAAMTAVAFAQEYKEWGRSFPENEAAEGLQSPAAWTGFFAAVTALALVGYGIVHVPFWRSDKEIFGVETWTCAKDDGKWTLGWIPKTGVQITVRGYIDLFNISCVPRKDGKGCDYDDAGWDQIDIVVHGKDGFDTKVSFDRKSDGVIATLRHHADIYGALGREILLALYNGKAAELKIHAPGRRLLYTQRVDLTGYNSGLETCSAHWRQEQAHARR